MLQLRWARVVRARTQVSSRAGQRGGGVIVSGNAVEEAHSEQGLQCSDTWMLAVASMPGSAKKARRFGRNTAGAAVS
jgi:hypothetical protein